ncbi:MAG: hypothetical protein COB81_05875 [Flavobacteriaceae bacterium]|nr:MAG: hypothetical protein COB81_05875 [Flavobacteriaceae bacterium]
MSSVYVVFGGFLMCEYKKQPVLDCVVIGFCWMFIFKNNLVFFCKKRLNNEYAFKIYKFIVLQF